MKKINLLLLVLGLLGQQANAVTLPATAVPPATFTNFMVNIQKIDLGVTGMVEGGILIGTGAASVKSLFVAGVQYTVPAGTQIWVTVKESVLKTSPYCAPLIIQKRSMGDIISSIAPNAASSNTLSIAIYNNSLTGTFSALSGVWKFVLQAINPNVTLPTGFFPLQCGF